jgi:2'-5' RNA ligase
MDEKRLYFIGILTPSLLTEKADSIKEEFARRFQSRHALKVPTHITLQEPFSWKNPEESKLRIALKEFFARFGSIQVACNGFGSFRKRSGPVIFIQVLKNPSLSQLRHELILFLRNNEFIREASTTIQPSNHSTIRPDFNPHITLANRDLSRDNFLLAWSEFSKREFEYEFMVENVHLLRHDGKIWEPIFGFELKKN